MSRLILAGVLLAFSLPVLAGSFADYPVHEFDLAWANSIYDDHGWGGHNGHITDEVFRKRLERARLQGEALLTRATTAIASRIKPGTGTPITVFNALSWQRTDPVQVALPLQAGAFRLVDDQGRAVPHQRVSPTVGIDAGSAQDASSRSASSSTTRSVTSAPGSSSQVIVVDIPNP